MNTRYRICAKVEESITHIISGCLELAKTVPLGHNRSVAYIHWNICRSYKLEITEESNRHQPTI